MVYHHALILMFEVMAVEQIGLIVFIRMGEVNGDSYGLPRPYENGVFPTEIGNRSAVGILRQPATLFGAVATTHYLKGKAVHMFRIG